MTAYVLAHGWHDSSKAEIPVPPGMKVTFLADQDLSAIGHIQLAQLLIGGVSAADTYFSGDPIPNYMFKPLEDEWIARLIQLNTHEVDLWIVGPDVSVVALCEGGDYTEGEDVGDDGNHTCAGLLGVAKARGVDHLHIMTCRVDIQVPEAERGADNALHDGEGGADTTFDQELFDFTASFLTLSFAEQCSRWEAMPYEQQVYCTGDGEISEWAEVYEARKLFDPASDDNAAFFAHFDVLRDAVRQRLLRDFPDIANALAKRYQADLLGYADTIAGFLGMAHGAAQDEYWMSLDPGQRELMMADPLVNDWAQAHQARQYLQLGDRLTPEVFVGIVGRLSDGAQNIVTTYPEAQQKLAEIS